MREIGNSRNDSRAPRLPKNEEKRARELHIREWAKNNGVSIGVARAYWAECDNAEPEHPGKKET